MSCVWSAGCESGDSSSQWVAPALLPLDPTEEYDLAPWWTNGTLLLYLDPTGAYALYPSNNRYQQPLERGSWDHASYAALWLRPYAKMQRPDTRITITRIDGELAMLLGDGPPLRPSEAPPRVLEDQLLGAWTGDSGSLTLSRGGRSSFSPAARNASLAAVVEYQGRWRVVNDRVVFTPSNGRPASELEILREGDAIRLRSQSMGTLQRAKQ